MGKSNYRITKEFIQKEYLDNKKSWTQIEKETGISTGILVYRAKKFGIRSRSRIEAQRVSKEQGRAINPHEGKPLSEAHKASIAKTLSDKYKNMSEAEYQKVCDRAKNAAKKNPDGMERFWKAGQKSLKTVSKKGSLLEHYLVEKLTELGYVVSHSKKHTIQSEDMHIDIFLEREKIAIEIDGPQHLRVIYSEEDYNKKKEKDQRKNGLILQEGYSIIRYGIERSRSFNAKQEALNEILHGIDELKKNPNQVVYLGKYKKNN